MHVLAQSTRIRTPQVTLRGSPGRTGMVLSSASHLFGVTVDCHSRGGAKQLYGVYQSPLPRRPTVAFDSDAPETSPFRTTGYSKRWLDPRGVADRTGHTRGNRDPRRVFDPGQSASAQLVSGSACGPHRCSIASDSAMSQPGAGVGANPLAAGSGQSPQRGHAGSRPRG